MNCPHCASPRTKEQPKITALGYRTFRCSDCRRTFNERTGTPFNYLEYPTDIVLLVVLWRCLRVIIFAAAVNDPPAKNTYCFLTETLAQC